MRILIVFQFALFFMFGANANEPRIPSSAHIGHCDSANTPHFLNHQEDSCRAATIASEETHDVGLFETSDGSEETRLEPDETFDSLRKTLYFSPSKVFAQNEAPHLCTLGKKITLVHVNLPPPAFCNA